MSNMENSFDDVSCLSPQNLGPSSPGKKQSKESTITVSGARLGSWGFHRHGWAVAMAMRTAAWRKQCPIWNLGNPAKPSSNVEAEEKHPSPINPVLRKASGQKSCPAAPTAKNSET
ncbi:hypothetical protein J0S82_017028 [Galemys pyrenaicus]|uniref:Uncharacterized protein n=1 Tax=Galemys pyrenaicus TaxID=202257 RepID=A0A8J5ZMV7_GALPY|nr:hypothetical protein J0S82_017028 [Galemys pyrenaicus]